eukprot:CAMPEP_0113482624 /NCGR_PEP_ID=MMETSP0014_2-20120614/23016_1 /TAXON_ID=2857 /ORGANISM="Nitzschia sp." /LENGTH=701 /DNA_ID=CAMNT_0000376149 /DNA_START=27 /DNA_END=2132 /DNA_ORIENTATION=+ /assembly_acc=CAM_ASM_000159
MSDEEEIKKKKTKKKKSKRKDKEEKNQYGGGDLELAHTSSVSVEKDRDVTVISEGYPMAMEETDGEKDAMIRPTTEKHNSIDNFTPDMDMVIDERGREVNISANLTPCAYSIIFVSKTCSVSFFYALFAFCFQMTIAGLTLADLVDWSKVSEEGFSAIRVPVNVPGYVRVAGYMVMTLAVVYFTDLLDSIETLHEGYHDVILKQAPHATKCKWILAYTLQLFSGMLFLCVVFILNCQSSTVLSMLLNFAAMQFVTEIDDVAFSLAERGYFSMSLKKSCDDVTKMKTPDNAGPWFRRIALLLFMVAVVTGYSVVYRNQEQGLYSCNVFDVQFGDEAWSWLPLYSGRFNNWINPKRESNRWVYVDEISQSASTFMYCRETQSWVFGIFSGDPNYGESETDHYYDEICEQKLWFLSSPQTNSFDALFGSASGWLTTTEDQSNALLFPVDYLSMRCVDCNSNTCNEQGGSCQSDLDISAKPVCVCNEGFYGSQCQFDNSTICPSLTFDATSSPFAIGDAQFPSSYNLVVDENGDPITYFDKTVFAYVYPEDDPEYGFINLIIFYGRRYFYIVGDWTLVAPNATAGTAAAEVVSFLQEDRQSGYSLDTNVTTPVFVSDPLDKGTAGDQFTPTSIAWYQTKLDEYGNAYGVGASVGTRLICEQCRAESLFCETGNCIVEPGSEYGQCSCSDGWVGARCEKYDPTTAA